MWAVRVVGLNLSALKARCHTTVEPLLSNTLWVQLSMGLFIEVVRLLSDSYYSHFVIVVCQSTVWSE